MQDVFCIGDEGRINTPSTSDGKNWIWRMDSSLFDAGAAEWLKNLGKFYGRNICAK